MELRLRHLPADVVELGALERATLASRPRCPGFPSLLVPARVEQVEAPDDRADRATRDERASLAERLEQRLTGLGPHVRVLDAVRALAAPGASAVLSTTAPALGGGHLAGLYGGLQAAVLARAFAAAWERPVVPLVWIDADATDLVELGRLRFRNENLDLARAGLAGLGPAIGTAGGLVLDGAHRLGPIREHLRQSLWAGPHRDAALELFLPHPGESLARAATRALTAVLGPLGVVVVEPDWMRGEASRVLARVVGLDPLRLLDVEAGTHLPLGDEGLVRHLPGRSGGRVRTLRAGGDGFRYDDEPGSRTAEELAAQIVTEPGEWVSGPLFLPLVQDLCLPVAARVAPWSDLAGAALLEPLREALDAPHTPFVARQSCTLIDPECERALERSGLELADALRASAPGPEAAGEPGEPREPTGASRALRSGAEQAAASLRGAAEALAALDPGLSRQLDRAIARLRKDLDELATRAGRVAANRSGKQQRHLRRLANALRPAGASQESVSTPLEVCARFGTDWIEALAGLLEPFPSEHLAVLLPETGAE